jgi:hypothetical protein
MPQRYPSPNDSMTSIPNTVKVLLGTLKLGDVEDPEIYAAGPLLEWQNTDKGKWCLENSIDKPYFTITPDHRNWGYTIKIIGELMEKDYTYFSLKWEQE